MMRPILISKDDRLPVQDANISDGRRVFISGTAGFIGFHLAKMALDEGFIVHGFDGMTDYYDVSLKRRRHQILRQYANFSATEAMLEDASAVRRAVAAGRPDIIIHLAAQAGVRYGLEHPRAYVDSNIVGMFNMLEAVREVGCEHFLMASTSSAYGANAAMPFRENQAVAHPVSLYAATKLAGEAMAHSYAHLHDIPTTILRFFTVYGPWGRPDLAMFQFVAAILDGRPIDIYNHGEMARDFTYVGDVVRAVRLLMDAPPLRVAERDSRDSLAPAAVDSLSPAAPWRSVNIGHGEPVSLMDFVGAVEAALGQKAQRNYLPMQPGDVAATWADCAVLDQVTGYRPRTSLADGVEKFVRWYREYYDK